MEDKYTKEPAVQVRFGHGLGKVVDARRHDAPVYIGHWAARAQAGSRLLITADSHKQIKAIQKFAVTYAKTGGLKLRWRFAREVKSALVYVHPEYVEGTTTEYHAWALVTARAIPMSPAAKRRALVSTAVRTMVKAETENPTLEELPLWVRELGPTDSEDITQWLDQLEETRDGEKELP